MTILDVLYLVCSLMLASGAIVLTHFYASSWKSYIPALFVAAILITVTVLNISSNIQ